MSIVITAQSHNPSVLTHDFLVSSGIVPSEWNVINSINIPPFSLIGYQNGVQWTLDENRMVVAENCGLSFQDLYYIHPCVVKYLNQVGYVPYRSLGLNCVVSIESDDPDGWLIKRFLKEGQWSHGDHKPLSMIPRFKFEANGPDLNLAFGDQIISKDNVEKAITIDCNVHYEGPLDVAGLQSAINLWDTHQRLIVEVLNTLLGDE